MPNRTRNLNPFAFFESLAAEHRPEFAFKGRTPAQFKAWQKAALPRVLATLGTRPKKVDLNPELLAEWTEDGLVKQRWVIDVQPNLSAVVLVFRPEGLAKGEKLPAILCCHGHGGLGKDGPMGLAFDAAGVGNIKFHNYDYGRQMARQGYVTYSLDWLGFGERDSRKKPYDYKGLEGRDPCNVHYLCATMLGTSMLALNCHDAARATDLVCSQPFVDGKKLGVMGLSLGGTMTTFVALTDPRMKAANIICYAGPWHEIAYRTYNVCGSQVAPGVFGLVDISDLQGLIAPRPLLLEVGLQDSCFLADHSLENAKAVERIYKAAGLGDRFETDIFPGEHAWGGHKSAAFFEKWLK
ncbi:MAG: prolyl oligopeptidase family serine peptidase [Planctomycetota bacterium]|nr:prolyl oligopeptidase family serine peptidase [Planctomycetota bacterium]